MVELSVPDRVDSQPVAKKEVSESDSAEKWKNIGNAFNLSGRHNGRSRIS